MIFYSFFLFVLINFFGFLSFAAQSDGFDDSFIFGLFYNIYDILYSIWNYPLFSMDNQQIALVNLVMGICLFVVGLKLARYLSLLIRNKLLKVISLDPTVSYALGKISHYFFIIIITLIVLDISNIPVTVFALVGGALAISIGAGGQHVINNFLSGLVTMIEAPIKVGDLIEIDGMSGRVKSIDSRCVNLKTQANTNILIPHSNLLQNKFINYTFKDNIVRCETVVKVNQSDVPASKVCQILVEAVRSYSDILESPRPESLLLGFENNLLIIEINFWLDLSVIDRRKTISDVNHIIEKTLRENSLFLAIQTRQIIKQ
jgi:small-conductance mechanosensitive channel